MLTVKIISVGTLKEPYLRDAVSEYKKRLTGFCRVEEINLKEAKLPENPTASEIDAALTNEGAEMLALLSPRAYKIALCVEGKQFSSEELAKRLEDVTATASEICLIIGSSYGLSPRVKEACDLRLSFSALTFPHQLMRVMLFEVLYRSMNIIRGTKYHK